MLGMVVVGAGLLGGCTAQDQRIERLDYVPGKPAPKITGQAVGVATPTEAHSLPINKLGEPIVGDVAKHDGSVSAHVVCADSIPRWVGTAVTGELKAAGINAGLGLEAKPGRTIVRTEVTQLKNETQSQWSSNAVTSTIALDFRIEKDGKRVGAMQVTGTGKVESAAKLTDVMHEAMQMALHDAMKKVIPDLANGIRNADQDQKRQ
jgi:hypothetical protein